MVPWFVEQEHIYCLNLWSNFWLLFNHKRIIMLKLHTRGHYCTFFPIWRTQNGVMLYVSMTLVGK